MEKKLQLVYVLVSSEKDIYLEQAYVSMYSAKYYMPDVRIILLVDELTNASFTGIRKEEVKYADEIKIIETPEGMNAKNRSRYIKTNLRNYVEGYILYVDVDTIIVKPLYEVLETDADIAGCYDTHCVDFKENPYYIKDVISCRTFDFPIEDEAHFFNGGIAYSKDTEVAHKFYTLWHKNMAESVKRGMTQDQPSLIYTNYMMGHVMKPLGDVWNCQLKFGIKYLKDAKIVHYLCTNKSKNKERQFFILNDERVLLQIKQTGIIPEDVIKTVKDPFYGLSPFCLCLAGDDVYFFGSYLCRAARSIYNKDVFSKIDGFIGSCWKHVKKYIKKG